MSDSHYQSLSFTTAGALTGARRALPLALSGIADGLVFGVLARQSGLTVLETLLMSGLVVAGSAQFLVLGLWATPLPVLSILLATLLVNLRHLLMGATLSRWFSDLSPVGRYGSAFFLFDESWALTVSEFEAGSQNGAFMLGGGLALAAGWVGSTVAGHLLGTTIQDPARWGLDVAFTAVFVALLAGLWRGKSDLLPWAVAGAVALVTAVVIPGTWYILAGGLAGSLIGAFRDDG